MKEVNPETFTTDISGMNKRKAFATLKDFVLSDEMLSRKNSCCLRLEKNG